MDFSALIADLRGVAEKYKGKDTEPKISTVVYVDMFTKILLRADKVTEKYEDQIVMLWVALNQLASIYQDLSALDARNQLCKFIFSMCAKAVLNIQWPQLDDDNRAKQNFQATVKGVHDMLKDVGFNKFALILDLMESHWTHPVLSEIMSGEDEESEEALNFILKEDPEILKLRIEIMMRENCEEFALNLCKWSLKHPGLKHDLKVREQQLQLLYKLRMYKQMQEECEKLSCHRGLKIMTHLEKSSSNQALLIRLAQTFVVQDWMKPERNCCTQELLKMWIRHQYLEDKDEERFLESIWAVAKVSSNTNQIGVLIDGVRKECGDTFIQLYTELCKFAINIDKGCVEQEIKKGDMEAVKERQLSIAKTCIRMAYMLKDFDFRIARISALTAFALDPTKDSLNLVSRLYWTIKKTSATSKESKINPATLYEMERLLGFMRPEYLNSDKQWKELMPLCHKYKDERTKILEQAGSEYVPVINEETNKSSISKALKTEAPETNASVPEKSLIESMLTSTFPSEGKVESNKSAFTVKALDKTITDLKKSLNMNAVYKEKIQDKLSQPADKKPKKPRPPKESSDKKPSTKGLSKPVKLDGAGKGGSGTGQLRAPQLSGALPTTHYPISPEMVQQKGPVAQSNLPHSSLYSPQGGPLSRSPSLGASPTTFPPGHSVSSTPGYNRQSSVPLPGSHGNRGHHSAPQVSPGAAHKQPPSAQWTPPSVIRDINRSVGSSPQECAKIAQQIAALHMKQRSERAMLESQSKQSGKLGSEGKAMLNSHNLPTKSQISDLLSMTLKAKSLSGSAAQFASYSSNSSEQLQSKQRGSKPVSHSPSLQTARTEAGKTYGSPANLPQDKNVQQRGSGKSTSVSGSGAPRPPVQRGNPVTSNPAVKEVFSNIQKEELLQKGSKRFLASAGLLDKLKQKTQSHMTKASVPQPMPSLKPVLSMMVPTSLAKDVSGGALVKTISEMLSQNSRGHSGANPSAKQKGLPVSGSSASAKDRPKTGNMPHNILNMLSEKERNIIVKAMQASKLPPPEPQKKRSGPIKAKVPSSGPPAAKNVPKSRKTASNSGSSAGASVNSSNNPVKQSTTVSTSGGGQRPSQPFGSVQSPVTSVSLSAAEGTKTLDPELLLSLLQQTGSQPTVPASLSSKSVSQTSSVPSLVGVSSVTDTVTGVAVEPFMKVQTVVTTQSMVYSGTSVTTCTAQPVLGMQAHTQPVLTTQHVMTAPQHVMTAPQHIMTAPPVVDTTALVATEHVLNTNPQLFSVNSQPVMAAPIIETQPAIGMQQLMSASSALANQQVLNMQTLQPVIDSQSVLSSQQMALTGPPQPSVVVSQVPLNQTLVNQPMLAPAQMPLLHSALMAPDTSVGMQVPDTMYIQDNVAAGGDQNVLQVFDTLNTQLLPAGSQQSVSNIIGPPSQQIVNIVGNQAPLTHSSAMQQLVTTQAQFGLQTGATFTVREEPQVVGYTQPTVAVSGLTVQPQTTPPVQEGQPWSASQPELSPAVMHQILSDLSKASVFQNTFQKPTTVQSSNSAPNHNKVKLIMPKEPTTVVPVSAESAKLVMTVKKSDFSSLSKSVRQAAEKFTSSRSLQPTASVVTAVIQPGHMASQPSVPTAVISKPLSQGSTSFKPGSVCVSVQSSKPAPGQAQPTSTVARATVQPSAAPTVSTSQQDFLPSYKPGREAVRSLDPIEVMLSGELPDLGTKEFQIDSILNPCSESTTSSSPAMPTSSSLNQTNSKLHRTAVCPATSLSSSLSVVSTCRPTTSSSVNVTVPQSPVLPPTTSSVYLGSSGMAIPATCSSTSTVSTNSEGEQPPQDQPFSMQRLFETGLTRTVLKNQNKDLPAVNHTEQKASTDVSKQSSIPESTAADEKGTPVTITVLRERNCICKQGQSALVCSCQREKTDKETQSKRRKLLEDQTETVLHQSGDVLGKVSTQSATSQGKAGGNCSFVMSGQVHGQDEFKEKLLQQHCQELTKANPDLVYQQMSVIQEVKPVPCHRQGFQKRSSEQDTEVNRCLICGEVFRSVEELRSHVVTTCPRRKGLTSTESGVKDSGICELYCCGHCNFTSRMEHIASKHVRNCGVSLGVQEQAPGRLVIKFECVACNKMFLDRKNAFKHVKSTCGKATSEEKTIWLNSTPVTPVTSTKCTVKDVQSDSKVSDSKAEPRSSDHKGIQSDTKVATVTGDGKDVRCDTKVTLATGDGKDVRCDTEVATVTGDGEDIQCDSKVTIGPGDGKDLDSATKMLPITSDVNKFHSSIQVVPASSEVVGLGIGKEGHKPETKLKETCDRISEEKSESNETVEKQLLDASDKQIEATPSQSEPSDSKSDPTDAVSKPVKVNVPEKVSETKTSKDSDRCRGKLKTLPTVKKKKSKPAASRREKRNSSSPQDVRKQKLKGLRDKRLIKPRKFLDEDMPVLPQARLLLSQSKLMKETSCDCRCRLCGAVVKRDTSVVKHFSRKHNFGYKVHAKRYRCRYCDCSFQLVSKEEVRKHMLKHTAVIIRQLESTGTITKVTNSPGETRRRKAADLRTKCAESLKRIAKQRKAEMMKAKTSLSFEESRPEKYVDAKKRRVCDGAGKQGMPSEEPSRRGRPRKVPAKEEAAEIRGPGRPRKFPSDKEKGLKKAQQPEEDSSATTAVSDSEVDILKSSVSPSSSTAERLTEVCSVDASSDPSVRRRRGFRSRSSSVSSKSSVGASTSETSNRETSGIVTRHQSQRRGSQGQRSVSPSCSSRSHSPNQSKRPSKSRKREEVKEPMSRSQSTDDEQEIADKEPNKVSSQTGVVTPTDGKEEESITVPESEGLNSEPDDQALMHMVTRGMGSASDSLTIISGHCEETECKSEHAEDSEVVQPDSMPIVDMEDNAAKELFTPTNLQKLEDSPPDEIKDKPKIEGMTTRRKSMRNESTGKLATDNAAESQSRERSRGGTSTSHPMQTVSTRSRSSSGTSAHSEAASVTGRSTRSRFSSGSSTYSDVGPEVPTTRSTRKRPSNAASVLENQGTGHTAIHDELDISPSRSKRVTKTSGSSQKKDSGKAEEESKTSEPSEGLKTRHKSYQESVKPVKRNQRDAGSKKTEDKVKESKAEIEEKDEALDSTEAVLDKTKAVLIPQTGEPLPGVSDSAVLPESDVKAGGEVDRAQLDSPVLPGSEVRVGGDEDLAKLDSAVLTRSEVRVGGEEDLAQLDSTVVPESDVKAGGEEDLAQPESICKDAGSESQSKSDVKVGGEEDLAQLDSTVVPESDVKAGGEEDLAQPESICKDAGSESQGKSCEEEQLKSGRSSVLIDMDADFSDDKPVTDELHDQELDTHQIQSTPQNFVSEFCKFVNLPPQPERSSKGSGSLSGEDSMKTGKRKLADAESNASHIAQTKKAKILQPEKDLCDATEDEERGEEKVLDKKGVLEIAIVQDNKTNFDSEFQKFLMSPTTKDDEDHATPSASGMDIEEFSEKQESDSPGKMPSKPSNHQFIDAFHKFFSNTSKTSEAPQEKKETCNEAKTEDKRDESMEVCTEDTSSSSVGLEQGGTLPSNNSTQGKPSFGQQSETGVVQTEPGETKTNNTQASTDASLTRSNDLKTGSSSSPMGSDDLQTGGSQTGSGGSQTGSGGSQTGQGGSQTGSGGSQAGQGGSQTVSGGSPAGQGGSQTGPCGSQTGSGGSQTGQGGSQTVSGGSPAGQGGSQTGQCGSQTGSGGSQAGSGGSQTEAGGSQTETGGSLIEAGGSQTEIGGSTLTSGSSPNYSQMDSYDSQTGESVNQVPGKMTQQAQECPDVEIESATDNTGDKMNGEVSPSFASPSSETTDVPVSQCKQVQEALEDLVTEVSSVNCGSQTPSEQNLRSSGRSKATAGRRTGGAKEENRTVTKKGRLRSQSDGETVSCTRSGKLRKLKSKPYECDFDFSTEVAAQRSESSEMFTCGRLNHGDLKKLPPYNDVTSPEYLDKWKMSPVDVSSDSATVDQTLHSLSMLAKKLTKSTASTENSSTDFSPSKLRKYSGKKSVEKQKKQTETSAERPASCSKLPDNNLLPSDKGVAKKNQIPDVTQKSPSFMNSYMSYVATYEAESSSKTKPRLQKEEGDSSDCTSRIHRALRSFRESHTGTKFTWDVDDGRELRSKSRSMSPEGVNMPGKVRPQSKPRSKSRSMSPEGVKTLLKRSGSSRVSHTKSSCKKSPKGKTESVDKSDTGADVVSRDVPDSAESPDVTGNMKSRLRHSAAADNTGCFKQPSDGAADLEQSREEPCGHCEAKQNRDSKSPDSGSKVHHRCHRASVRTVIHKGTVFEIGKDSIKETTVVRKDGKGDHSRLDLAGEMEDETHTKSASSGVRSRRSQVLEKKVDRVGEVVSEKSVQAGCELNEYICAKLNEIRKQRKKEEPDKGSRWKVQTAQKARQSSKRSKAAFPYSFTKSRRIN